jgi:predicted nucleic acid-binding protein
MARLILDSGGLSALADGDPRAVAWVLRATQRGALIGIPAPVLAECITGQQRDAAVYRVIPSMDTVLPTTAEIARTAGALRYLTRLSHATVDAIIVATAVHQDPRSIILTSDPDDLQLLVDCSNVGISVRSVNEA